MNWGQPNQSVYSKNSTCVDLITREHCTVLFCGIFNNKVNGQFIFHLIKGENSEAMIIVTLDPLNP